jgi:hypothetical protein
MEAQKMGIQLTPEEKFEVFGPDYRESWETEAEQTWGDGDPWKESRRRTGGYRKEDWQRIKAESGALDERMVQALADGLAPGSGRAMDLAEAHRRHITEHYYPCGHEIHRGLAAMYLADPRFTAVYEQLAPGLARWLHDAIIANAGRAESR